MANNTSTAALEATLQKLTTTALSSRSRYGHVALLLMALLASGTLAALLATEPALPLRTQTAFALMLGMGLCWTAYAVWVLRQRQPLLANHRVVAGRMAVVFTTLFFVAAGSLALATGQALFQAAAMTGGSLLVLAVVVLVQAHGHRTRLQNQRRELEQALGIAN